MQHPAVDEDYDEEWSSLFYSPDQGDCCKRLMESKTIDGTRYDKNDYMIAVQWYDRLAEDEEQRTFELTDPAVGFFNSTELRLVGKKTVSSNPFPAITIFLKFIFELLNTAKVWKSATSFTNPLFANKLVSELTLVSGEPRARFSSPTLGATANANLRVRLQKKI